jgi:hypothetical protein
MKLYKHRDLSEPNMGLHRVDGILRMRSFWCARLQDSIEPLLVAKRLSVSGKIEQEKTRGRRAGSLVLKSAKGILYVVLTNRPCEEHDMLGVPPQAVR